MRRFRLLPAAFATQANPNPASGFTDRLPSSIFANVRMLPARDHDTLYGARVAGFSGLEACLER